MRVVLLTGSGPEHAFLAARLVEDLDGALVGIVTSTATLSPGSQIARYLRRYTLAQLVSRVSARLYRVVTRASRTRERVLRDWLHPNRLDDPMFDGIPRFVVPSFNGTPCVNLLRSLEPDLIAVYGTPVIRKPVIELAAGGIVNMHTGISPTYRGADSVFWALHNAEPQHVGVTIHRLTADVDGGPILAQARPAIAPTDDENTLFAKCVIAGSELYARTLQRLDSGDCPVIEQRLPSGREYRFVDRTMSAERRVKRLLRDGLLIDHASATASLAAREPRYTVS